MLKAIWDASTNRPYMAPALRFEELTGISGVGQVYKMPNNLSMQHVESLMPILDISLFRMKAVTPLKEQFRFSWAMAAEKIMPFRSDQQAKFLRLAEVLGDLNPELKDIQFDRQSAPLCRNFIVGVTSGFKPQDIQYFMDRLYWDSRTMSEDNLTGQNAQLRYRCDKIFGEDKDVMQWVACPETIEHIHRELDKTYGPDPMTDMPDEKRDSMLRDYNEGKFSPPDWKPSFWQALKYKLR